MFLVKKCLIKRFEWEFFKVKPTTECHQVAFTRRFAHSDFCAPQSVDIKSDFCDLGRATWHCSPCSQLVLELKRADSATFSAGALSKLALVQSAPLSALQPWVWTLWRMCVHTPCAHFYRATNPSATATMKITSGLQTEFPQAPAMPLFHPVNCTSPFPSLCSLLTFNFSLLPSRLEKVLEQDQDEQICDTDPSFYFHSAHFWIAQQQNHSFFLSPSLYLSVCLQNRPLFLCRIWFFFSWLHVNLFIFYSHISVLIALGRIFLSILTFLGFPFMLRVKFRACGLSVQYFTGRNRIAERVFCVFAGETKW